MKILILGDLHGFVMQKPSFSFDVIISTGDLCDDRYIRPFIQEGFRLGVSWDELVDEDERLHLLRQTIQSGKRVAKRLSELGKLVYIVQGNWDITLKKNFVETYFQKKKSLRDATLQVHELPDCVIVGYDASGSPELPWRKNEWEAMSEAKQKKTLRVYTKKYGKVEKLYKKALKLKKPIILLSHNQPNRTKLDKVTNKDANIINKHLGSLIIRRIIDQYQPKLCIAGHIHENKGFSRIRKTQCLNAGSRSSAFLLDTTSWKIIPKRIKMQHR